MEKNKHTITAVSDSVFWKEGFKDYVKFKNCKYSPHSPMGELWSMGYYAAQEIDQASYDNQAEADRVAII